MNVRRLSAIAAVAAVAAATGCGSHGNAVPSAATNAGVPTPYTGPASLANFHWHSELMQGATLVGPARDASMSVTVLVRQQKAQGLLNYAQQASDPRSSLYRQFLSPQEIGTRFGASTSDYRSAAQYFRSNGLAVAGWPQHLALAVSGPQSAMERAFGTRFGVYQKDGEQFLAPMSAPHFSTAVPVDEVANLVSYRTKHAYLIQLPPRAGAGINIGYSPQQIQAAFDFTGAYAKGFDGTGISVGIIGTGPISNGPNGDVAALASLYNLNKVANVTQVNVTASDVAAGLAISGIPTASPSATPNPNSTPNVNEFPFGNGFASPPPVTAPCSGDLPSCNPEDGEAQLDTQQIAALAPGSNVLFFLGYNKADCDSTFFPTPCATTPPGGKPGGAYAHASIGIEQSDPEIEEAIAQNSADVLSISYGGGEPQEVGAYYNASGAGYEPLEFAALAAEGVAVFVSSGDSGSAECLNGSGYDPRVCVSWPSGSKDVISVGGVTAALDDIGQLTAPMTAWGTTSSDGTQGSGGGVSTIFTAPSWQAAALHATMREQPDVSMLGDPGTGVTVVENAFSSAQPYSDIGGTSVSAPQMAAVWALVLQACKSSGSCNAGGAHGYRLGNPAPYLYSIYKGSNLTSGSFSPHLSYAQTFRDIVYGSISMQNPNGPPVPGATAGPGYDETTGVGVPYVGHLIQAVTGVTVP